MVRRASFVFLVLASVWTGVGGRAAAAVTPGWECIPTAAGQAVVSGGTGTSPSCGPGTTAVLAPTYVAAGVGGKPTVEFSTVNVQIVSGTGSTTGSLNGEGNLVVGYAENPVGRKRTGSNNLIVGSSSGWASYGEIVGGWNNLASGPYATVFGRGNTASGSYSSALGGQANVASGDSSSVGGGHYNLAFDPFASVDGGCQNVAGSANALTGSCSSGAEAVLGGLANVASGLEADVAGGNENVASGPFSSVGGGAENAATDSWGAVAGGCSNTTGGGTNPNFSDCSWLTAPSAGAILGGADNLVYSANGAAIAGGFNNNVGASFGSINGGIENFVNDLYGSILGGCSNETGASSPTACGVTLTPPEADSVAGGLGNDAFGEAASILGGQSEVLTGNGTSKAGPMPFGP